MGSLILSGEQTVDVFLAGSEQKNLDFAFRASDR
jgi:hypothetical protein